MADMDNYSEINQNFDTIKTLLNSIRAQGILNTSDVDKLLSGINSKLEKINTDEDIDLIKIFLSELKQNFEERHSVLISKFGAIESLFSTLLKNSSEMPKSTDIKELFDIVATNLSVFSREVVSQKESLTDISLRLDALRSDDSQKKEIIKNIALLKNDLERLNNGFDSIVISLNDNFKTIVKTITTLDKTEHLDKFANSLNNIENSSNTVLSALQMLDKKTELVELALSNVVTKEDLSVSNQRILEISAQGQEISSIVNNLSNKYAQIDKLSEKIDASVDIIVGLKALFEESDEKQANFILEQLKGLEEQLKGVNSDAKFEEFRASFEAIVNNISESSAFQDLNNSLSKVESEVKTSIIEVFQKLATLQDANVTRIVNDISSGADVLGSKINQTQSALAVLCEKKFSSVLEDITNLKTSLNQLDENNVAANNAIFSSVSDRLSVFEDGLKLSLDTQEQNINVATSRLVEQIDNIKNLSSVLDYKMDSSVVEVANIKKEFGSLQNAIEAVLALDFVNVVKELKVELYASKQELANTFETSTSRHSDKVINDLYGKYELLISKLNNVENELKKTQTDSLVDLKSILDKISASIVDVLSYVSEINSTKADSFDGKLDELADFVKQNSLNYVEGVRSVVDVLRVQVENNIKSLEDENKKSFDAISSSITESSDEIKKEIKYAYSKLIEIQDFYNEFKDSFEANSLNSNNKIDSVLVSSAEIRDDLDKKISTLKTSLVDKILEFKQEFTCENADKVSELKFSFENHLNKNNQDLSDLFSELRTQMKDFYTDDSTARASSLAKILENFVSLKDFITSLNEASSVNLVDKVNTILAEFEQVNSVLSKVDENIDGDLTRQLSIIESNFESLVSQVTILFDKSDKALSDKINEEFITVTDKIESTLSDKLDDYKSKIENTFDELKDKTIEQSKYMQERIADLNIALKNVLTEQAEENNKQIEEFAGNFKNIIDENIKLTAVDYVALKNKLVDLAKNIETNNQVLTDGMKSQISEISEHINTVLDTYKEEYAAKQLELANTTSADISAISQMTANNNNLVVELDTLVRENQTNLIQVVNTNKALLTELDKTLTEKSDSLKALVVDLSTGQLDTLNAQIEKFVEYFEAEKEFIQTSKDTVVEILKNEISAVSKNVEKETDVIIGELIEQFDLLKKAQADDVISLSTRMEEIVNDHIYNNVEELKSYLDIKTDNSVLTSKLDNLKIEMSASFEELVKNLNTMLDSSLFKSALSDFRVANELLVNSAVDRINSSVEAFFEENGRDFENKLAIFDKKFVDAVVDKYEEIKISINKYNDSFEDIQASLLTVKNSLDDIKKDVATKFDDLTEVIRGTADLTMNEIKLLSESFDNLRSQISNRSLDEAFQASVNKQITGLEDLVKEQLSYIEDINDLCSNSLPDVTELNTLVKHSILESIKQFSDKLDNNNIEEELNKVKSEIVTQLLNVFNQVSFVAEQEEILDFIQEKHDDLIKILSHIVTTSSEVCMMRDTVSNVDNKIDSLRDEIGSLNEKINAVISSDGEVDYIYSLQELESDIANLRLVLNEMKETSINQEFSDLISSTNEVYNLVESLKSDFPTKADFNNMAEDIVSISTRTNKLILSSDESYRTLQDNLQDFKLVINDLDERTRNFVKDAGIDKIDSKLNSINSMMVNGAKSNQVFNQVFEYLAEWVDNASNQINSISDKVETLDDIGQIKVMLADLKETASDNSNNVELIEALGDIFDKQVKKINAIETKLDKVIVETTINNKNNKIDMSPIEQTLNKFLVAMDEKLSNQQSKINSLEEKLAGVLEILDEKDTALLTKKVGGMDRQIAKLNKSIEKIASHVVEK